MYKWFLISLIFVAVYLLFSGEHLKYDSPNFRDGRFHNAQQHERGSKSVLSSVYRVLFDSKDLEPKTPPPAFKLSSDYVKSNTEGGLEAVWVSHASVLLKYNDIKILTDPVFSERASFSQYLGPKRFESINPIEHTDTGIIDVVIISHNHYDHLDKRAVQALMGRTKMFVVSLGVGQYLMRWGVDPLRIVELDWNDSYRADDITITAKPASHMSKRGFFDKDKTFWSSFVIELGVYKTFFSADTGYINDFKKIGAQCGGFDLALTDMGAYNAAWKQNHMTPEEAVQAAFDLRASMTLPIHWGTFQLSDFHWKEPIKRFTAEASRRNLKFTTPIQGEPIIIGEYTPKGTWWDYTD